MEQWNLTQVYGLSLLFMIVDTLLFLILNFSTTVTGIVLGIVMVGQWLLLMKLTESKNYVWFATLITGTLVFAWIYLLILQSQGLLTILDLW